MLPQCYTIVQEFQVPPKVTIVSLECSQVLIWELRRFPERLYAEVVLNVCGEDLQPKGFVPVQQCEVNGVPATLWFGFRNFLNREVLDEKGFPSVRNFEWLHNFKTM